MKRFSNRVDPVLSLHMAPSSWTIILMKSSAAAQTLELEIQRMSPLSCYFSKASEISTYQSTASTEKSRRLMHALPSSKHATWRLHKSSPPGAISASIRMRNRAPCARPQSGGQASKSTYTAQLSSTTTMWVGASWHCQVTMYFSRVGSCPGGRRACWARYWQMRRIRCLVGNTMRWVLIL
jgi:hypothetical protein